MFVEQAKAVAHEWVATEAVGIPGFRGAFFHGSITWLPDDAPLASTSDVDIMVVIDDGDSLVKPGKLLYRDVLLEVSYLSPAEVWSPEQVLAQYHLAGSFRTPGIIADPSGHLTELQAAVARDYAKRPWVVRRRDHAGEKILRGHSISEADPFHDQVVGWLFPAGILTHVLLVAGLRNPTVRRRYVVARDLLMEYERPDVYERLLDLLGCATIGPVRVEHHLATLADAFDATKSVIKTPFFFASDISDVARPIAIDGSRELISRGDHREAIFWLVATYSRCQKVLYHDAPREMFERFDRGYRTLLHELDIDSDADLRRRREDVLAALPEVCQVSDAIMAANPEIEN